ncbi:MAG: hypothetical protein E7261_00045 [Lachnospiraceae bacterium]|nr:hypothetical protein [Lachnospiraceae bacterium]
MEKDNKYNIKFEDSLDAISARECTGLIPSGYADEENLDKYRDIFEFGVTPHNAYHDEKFFRKNQK